MPIARTSHARTLLATLCFAAAGAVATLPFVLETSEPMVVASRLVPAAAVAAALLGAFAWTVGVEGQRGAWRGAVSGALVGLVAHPVMWALLALVVGAETGSPIRDRVGGTVGSGLFFGLFSALAYGPFTSTLGAVVGFGLQKTLEPPEPPARTHP